MDARPVKILLKSSIQSSQESFSYEGSCRRKGSLFCITYTDPSENTPTRVRIDAGPDGMPLHRRGAITARMEFCPDRDTDVKYKIDAFSADFVLKTRTYSFSSDDSSIRILTDYVLSDPSGEPVSENRQQMIITFKD